MTNLLLKREERRRQDREELRQEVRRRLRQALQELIPGEKAILFGSVTRPYGFHLRSDVDIAFVEEPKTISRYRLQVRLEELILHPVDLVLLSECRFRDKIQREGEVWTS